MQQVEKNAAAALRIDSVVKSSRIYATQPPALASISAAATTATNATAVTSTASAAVAATQCLIENAKLKNMTSKSHHNHQHHHTQSFEEKKALFQNLNAETVEKANLHHRQIYVHDQRVKFLIEFTAGAIGGGVSRTATAPIDRLRTVFQVQCVDTKDTNILKVWNYMLKEGKWHGLWRGNWVNVMKTAPENAIRLASYEKLKHLLFELNEDKETHTFSEKFVCGSTAGLIATLVLYPLKTVKTIMNLGHTGEFTSVSHCIRRTYVTHGLGAFYKGLVANSMAIMPSAGIDLATYETLKKYYSRLRGKSEPNVPEKLVLGSFSSCVGNLFVYPLLFARTRLQSNVNPAETTLGVLMHVWRRDGLRGCYRGFLLHIGKIGPAASISYVTFESVTKSFQLNSLN